MVQGGRMSTFQFRDQQSETNIAGGEAKAQGWWTVAVAIWCTRFWNWYGQ